MTQFIMSVFFICPPNYSVIVLKKQDIKYDQHVKLTVSIYCKFGNFGDIVFVNSIERHICDVKNSRLGMIYL